MNPSIEQPANAETPRRPWWRLHISTVLILLLAAAILTLANWPANDEDYYQYAWRYSHGWPWTYLVRGNNAALNFWSTTDFVEEFDPAALIWNLLIAAVVLAGVGVVFERRRRGRANVFQVSLREGFLVILILAVSFAWLGNAYHKMQSQQRIVNKCFPEYSDYGMWNVGWRHRGPAWLVAMSGDDANEPGWLSEVYTISQSSYGMEKPKTDELSNYRFKLLEQFPSLRHLDLQSQRMTDSEMKHLSQLNCIESLSLALDGTDRLELRHLQGLTRLKSLALSGRVTSDSLRHLSRLTQLRTLNLSGNEITDDGLAHLKTLWRLEVLDLSYNEITDDGLVHLHGLKRLKTLDLSNTQVTDEGVDALRRALPELEVYDD